MSLLNGTTRPPARLVLADGRVFEGVGVGGLGEVFWQGGQDAREAVAAARNEGNVGAAGGGAGDRGHAGGVIAGESHVAAQGIGVDLDVVAQ